MATYSKTLEGIKLTDELESLYQIALNLSNTDTVGEANANVDSGSEAAAAAVNSSAVRRALTTLPINKAKSILNKYNEEQQKNRNIPVIPLDVIKAMRSIFMGTATTTSDNPQQRINEFENALQNTNLVYTSPPSENDEDTVEKQKFRKRLERLKLIEESNKYKKMMANLDNTVEDDVTTKSMTYAASVGLNMIVAPMSFGVLMYFFAGQLFAWMVDDDEGDTTTANHQRVMETRRIIAGVVSGVAMLFIEMILFVIRTHEFDKATTKKKRKKTPSPFGYTKPKA